MEKIDRSICLRVIIPPQANLKNLVLNKKKKTNACRDKFNVQIELNDLSYRCKVLVCYF